LALCGEEEILVEFSLGSPRACCCYEFTALKIAESLELNPRVVGRTVWSLVPQFPLGPVEEHTFLVDLLWPLFLVNPLLVVQNLCCFVSLIHMPPCWMGMLPLSISLYFVKLIQISPAFLYTLSHVGIARWCCRESSGDIGY
jgi:hypothetical protein